MIQGQPELYQNESKYGPIPGIPVGTTWRTRQVTLDALSRYSLTTSGVILGKSVQRLGCTPIPLPEYLAGREALILS